MSGKGVNEMKKFLTVLLASVLIASMSSLVVCAAGSSSVSGNRVEQKSEPTPDQIEQRIEEEVALEVSYINSIELPTSAPKEARDAMKRLNDTTPVTVNFSGITTTEGFVSMVKKVDKIAPSHGFNMYSTSPFAFNTESLAALSGHDVSYIFIHNGVFYGISITPEQYSKITCGKNEFVGPLEIGRQLGTTRVLGKVE